MSEQCQVCSCAAKHAVPGLLGSAVAARRATQVAAGADASSSLAPPATAACDCTLAANRCTAEIIRIACFFVLFYIVNQICLQHDVELGRQCKSIGDVQNLVIITSKSSLLTNVPLHGLAQRASFFCE